MVQVCYVGYKYASGIKNFIQQLQQLQINLKVTQQ
jgi:hypothetical protein